VLRLPVLRSSPPFLYQDIDFGFLLSNSPGSLGFEMAPFKLTQDYIDILGTRFNDFKQLLKRCFFEVRRHAERIIMIVELMQKGERKSASRLGYKLLTRK
jgi:phosphatidylinositol kinase/protein kinase (PI-3  family)